MDSLYLLLALYLLVAMVTFWALFIRLIGRKDLRGREAWDMADPSDGFLAFLLGFFVAFFVLAVANPIRFARVVAKAVFWPVTACLAIQGRPGQSDAPTEQNSLLSGSRAPRLSTTYINEGLARAGRPATPHNLFALQERLGIMFTMKARQFIEEFGDIDDWRRFVGRAGYPHSLSEMETWPQRVLDAIVEWDDDIAAHIQDFPQKYLDMLLETCHGEVGFFSGLASEPLPTATDWNMNGLAQPSARPLSPPEFVAAPYPPSPSSRMKPSRNEEALTGPIALSVGLPTAEPYRVADSPAMDPVYMRPVSTAVPTASVAGTGVARNAVLASMGRHARVGQVAGAGGRMRITVAGDAGGRGITGTSSPWPAPCETHEVVRSQDPSRRTWTR